MKNYIYVININTMKNKVLFTLMICFATMTTWAQTIPNFSFETWATGTNYDSLNLTTPVIHDTVISTNPTNWTTINQVTNGTTFGHKVLVTESNQWYVGSHSIQLTSDSLHATLTGVPIIGTLNLNFVCPGFAVCGDFPINFNSLLHITGQFNPALLSGAGIPVSARYDKIGGYIKYTPVGGDSAYIVAVLRQGTTVVATAKFTHDSTDANWVYFEAPFVYQNCLLPDTMVYTISSGNPYSINGVATGGQSGQHQGSTLLVDSVYLGNIITLPNALNDSAHTHANTPLSIHVLVNDQACDTLTLTSVTQPAHGTAVLSGDSVIYTSTGSFQGLDTFSYIETSGGVTDTGTVVVRVYFGVGINPVAEGKTSIYPNPASTKLYVSASNPSVSELRIYDMLGKVMKAENFYANTAVDLSGFSNGLYIIQFSGADGKMISSSRFIVVK